jgi:hypothetical protein
MTFKMKAWTGPTLVKQLADKLREAGINVTLEGTETVYFVAEGSYPDAAGWNTLVDLMNTHGTDFGLRIEEA